MPRGGGEDHRKWFADRGPVLEACLDHLDIESGQVFPRCRRQGTARLDAGDAVPTPRQRQCRLASRTTHLQQARRWRQASDLEKAVVELTRVFRPSALVKLCRSVERRRQTLPFIPD